MKRNKDQTLAKWPCATSEKNKKELQRTPRWSITNNTFFLESSKNNALQKTMETISMRKLPVTKKLPKWKSRKLFLMTEAAARRYS